MVGLMAKTNGGKRSEFTRSLAAGGQWQTVRARTVVMVVAVDRAFLTFGTGTTLVTRRMDPTDIVGMTVLSHWQRTTFPLRHQAGENARLDRQNQEYHKKHAHGRIARIP